MPPDLRDAVVEEVADDWHERWREFHRGVAVGAFWIGPPWERPPAGLDAVVIDPGRAFGTGAHATTRLCVEWLLQLERTSLLDVGCGSGVLAIVAAMIGFDPVFAVDDDPAAVEAAQRNARANGVRVTVERLDALRDPLPDTHAAVANIAADTVAAVAPSVRAATLVTSGYPPESGPTLQGFALVERRTTDGWAADLWRRPE